MLATREMLIRVKDRESLPGTDATGDPWAIEGDVVVPDIGVVPRAAYLLDIVKGPARELVQQSVNDASVIRLS